MEIPELPVPEQASTSPKTFWPDGEYSVLAPRQDIPPQTPFDMEWSVQAAQQLLAQTEHQRREKEQLTAQNESYRQMINQLESERSRMEKEQGIDVKTGLLTEQALEEAYSKLFLGEKLHRRHSAGEELHQEHPEQPAAPVKHSLAVLDLDNFKQVNDEHGHKAGDLVLRAFADAAKDLLRDTDVLCRLNRAGDEFAFLMPHTDPETAAIIIERVRHFLNELGAVEGNTVGLGVSIGIAEATPDYHDTRHRADLAETSAKKQENKNKTAIYDTATETIRLFTKT